MKYWIVSFTLLLQLAILSGLRGQHTIKWLSWETAMEKREAEPRKILVKVYIDNCMWCKRMQENTYSHPDIASYINDNFYPVAFNAETKGSFQYQGREYDRCNVVMGNKVYHELADLLLRGHLSFPTTVFLDESGELIQPISGYKSEREFEKIITYFASDRYQSTPWSSYERMFRSEIDR